eukprot:759142-Pelagomonas_calceolata.AAC.2
MQMHLPSLEVHCGSRERNFRSEGCKTHCKSAETVPITPEGNLRHSHDSCKAPTSVPPIQPDQDPPATGIPA